MVRLQTSLTLLNPSVLFLCVHNAGRSQMAAGFMRLLSGGRVDVFTGGSEPAKDINGGRGVGHDGEGHQHTGGNAPALGG